MKMVKRAQFFLLAAVIISAIIVGLAITMNSATIREQPKNFYDYSFNVKKEAGAVIDYEIFSNFADNANLSNFVELLASDMRQRDPTLSFLFLYGDSTSVTLKNFASLPATVKGGVIAMGPEESVIIPGASYKIESTIRLGSTAIKVPETSKDYGISYTEQYNLNPSDNPYIAININNYDFNFNISKSRQVIFIVEKEANNESYVAI